MNAKKQFEIRLSLPQLLLSLCALIGCFFFAFTLGAFMGSRLIPSFHVPVAPSLPPNPATAPPVSDYNSLDPRHPDADEASKNVAEVTFYDELPQTVEITPPPQKQQPEKNKAPSLPSADGDAPIAGTVEKASQEKVYTIQIAAFLQREKAYALADRLTNQGYTARVVSKANPAGETWHRVRVGSFKSPDDAKKLLPQFSHLESQPQIMPAE